MRSRISVALAALSLVVGLPGLRTSAQDAPGPDQVGAFTQAFQESGPNCHDEQVKGRTETICKPAAVSLVVLPDHRILYWDGLEATENVKYATALEFGDAAVNDQSRLLDLSGPTWRTPTPADGGANPGGYQNEYLIPNAPAPLDQVFNDPGRAPGALFCSDQVLLANGDVLTTGGTSYYSEPHVPGTDFGIAELEGLKNTRIYDPATNRWGQTGSMQYGRWYPGVVTLPSGNLFVASGVTKLIKPAYPDRPADSGRNVVQTETYHLSTGRWTYNGVSADKTLPLFPRLHLLPDGKVSYDAVGQVFNPDGQSYDELSWNNASVYDPSHRTWTDVGTPQLGFRGSTFSIMLPLEPPYTKASFLAAGGIIGVTPGTYVAVPFSRIDTVDTATGDSFTSTMPGNMANARWYSTGVLLPTGQVMAFSGADRDEVVDPGSGFAMRQAELFDPATGTWTPMASADHGRTYHNTAALLPEGRVLVGGHAPIPNGYGAPQTTPGGFSNGFRDPSFEIYSPPYLFWGPRPTITGAPRVVRYGNTITIGTPDPSGIDRVVLVRNTAITHLTDGDQREVVLKVLSRRGHSLTVAAPPDGDVAPPGPYMLFIVARSPKGPIPSVSRQLFVG